MYLSYGRCRKRCKPKSGQVQRGTGRFFRACVDPGRRYTKRTTTTVTTGLAIELAARLPIVELPDQPKAAGRPTGSRVSKFVLFTIILPGQVDSANDVAADLNFEYCQTWGCRYHKHQPASTYTQFDSKVAAGSNIQNYGAFLELFKQFSELDMFVYMDKDSAIHDDSHSMTPYLPGKLYGRNTVAKLLHCLLY